MKQRISYINTCMGFILILLNVACTSTGPSVSQGGGVETGNSTVVGQVVTGDGRPVSAAIVTIKADVWGDDPALFVADRFTDDSGFYRFDSVPGGRFRITEMNESGDSGCVRPFTINRNGDSTNLAVDSLRHVSIVRGQVVRHDGLGFSDIRVGLRGTKIISVVNAQGWFEFPRVAPGPHVLVAQSSSMNNGIPQLMSLNVPADTVLNLTFDIPLAKRQTLSFKPGMTWSYEESLWSFDTANVPSFDTFSHYQNFTVANDTLIDGMVFSTVDVDYNGIGFPMLTMRHSQARYYIRISADSVYVYESGNQRVGGLLKRQGQVANALSPNLSVVKVNDYDTARFHDFRIPTILNCIPNQIWYSRPKGDPRGNIPLKSRYAGNEVVTVPGGTYNCARIEWEWESDSTGDIISSPVKSVDFLADIGCIKKVIQSTDYAKTGNLGGSALELTICYTGTDTTSYQSHLPAMSSAEFDHLRTLALQSWSMDRFIAWVRALDTASALDPYRSDWSKKLPFIKNINAETYYVFLTCLDSAIFYNPSYQSFISPSLYEQISFIASFNDSAYFDSLFSRSIYNVPQKYVVAHSLTDFHYEPDRLFLLLFSPETRAFFAQGWSDCDRDWKTAGPCDLANTTAPFGRSAMAEAAAAQVAGKYRYVEFK